MDLFDDVPDVKLYLEHPSPSELELAECLARNVSAKNSTVKIVGDEEEQQKSFRFRRCETKYCNKSNKFVTIHDRSMQQYSALYHARLSKLRPLVERRALSLWSHQLDADKFLTSLINIPINTDCVIIGTVYKDMKLKPSILEEYRMELGMQKIPLSSSHTSLMKYTGSCDKLYLEDLCSRIVLGGVMEAHVNKFVSGLVIAARGTRDKDGCFQVTEFCFAGFPDKLNVIVPHNHVEAKYVAFVSGLNIGQPFVKHVSLQLLKDFLLGACGSDSEREISSNIVRLVVVGNSLTAAFNDASSLEEADAFFSQIASCVPVDVMPGKDDPTTYSLPQQCIHPIMFRHSKLYKNFQSTTNPYCFTVDNVKFLGSSGQPIADMCAFSDLNDMEALELTAKCRCIAPTAPDTLSCFPLKDDDVFCFAEDEEFPDVFFSGNHSELSYKYIQCNDEKVKLDRCNSTIKDGLSNYSNNHLLLCIPDFSKKQLMVLVDLISRKVSTVSFCQNLQE